MPPARGAAGPFRRSRICVAARLIAPGTFRFLDRSTNSRSERALIPRLKDTPTGVRGLFSKARTICLFWRYLRLLAMYRSTLSETSRIMAMARISPSVIRDELTVSRATISLLSLIRIIRTSLLPFLARANFWPTGNSFTRRRRLFLRVPSASRFLAASIAC